MKIACIGCSFTDHYTDIDEKSWPEFMADKLPNHEIYNLGISATGWAWHDIMIKHVVINMEPDLIIWQKTGLGRYHLFHDYTELDNNQSELELLFNSFNKKDNYYYFGTDKPRTLLNKTVAFIINDNCSFNGENYNFYERNNFLPVNDYWALDLTNQNLDFYKKVGINIHSFSLRQKYAKNSYGDKNYYWDHTNKLNISKSNHLSSSENEKLSEWIIDNLL